MTEEALKTDETAKKEPTPAAPAPALTRAVFVEFADGDLRVYPAPGFKLDRDALSMLTAAGPVAIPAGRVKEVRLQEVQVDQAGRTLEPKEARP